MKKDKELEDDEFDNESEQEDDEELMQRPVKPKQEVSKQTQSQPQLTANEVLDVVRGELTRALQLIDMLR